MVKLNTISSYTWDSATPKYGPSSTSKKRIAQHKSKPKRSAATALLVKTTNRVTRRRRLPSNDEQHEEVEDDVSDEVKSVGPSLTPVSALDSESKEIDDRTAPVHPQLDFICDECGRCIPSSILTWFEQDNHTFLCSDYGLRCLSKRGRIWSQCFFSMKPPADFCPRQRFFRIEIAPVKSSVAVAFIILDHGNLFCTMYNHKFKLWLICGCTCYFLVVWAASKR